LKSKLIYAAVLQWLFLISFGVKGQFFNSKKYTIENSSAIGNIFQVQQDKSGAIWWVNDEDFTRYNGIVFQNTSYSKLSASYRFVFPYIDDDGKLWLCLGTEKKVDVYSFENNDWKKVTSLLLQDGEGLVSFFATYKDDKYWVGLATPHSVYIWENNNWEELPLDNTTEVKQIQASGNTAYIITGAEIYYLKPGRPPYNLQLPPDVVAALTDVNIYTNPWITNSEPELWLLTSSMIGYVKNSTLVVAKLYNNTGYNFTRLRSNGSGRVFLLTATNKMWQFDLQGGIFAAVEGIGLGSTDNINQLYTDRENNLWLATEDGVLKTTMQSISFMGKHEGIGSLPIQAVAKSNKRILAAGPKGITELENGKVIDFHPFTEPGLINPRQRILQLWADSVGNAWLLSNTQGLWYSDGGINWTQVKGNARLLCFFVAPNQKIYAANEGGLFEATPEGLKLLYNIPTGTVPKRLAWHYDKLILLSNKGIFKLDNRKWEKLKHENGTDFSVPSYAHYHVYDNLAILGTAKGIFYLKEFNVVQYEADTIWGTRPYYDITVDKRGAVWLASDTGIVVMDKKGAPKIFAYKGFQFNENEVSPMVKGAYGKIWITSRTGLMVYEPEFEMQNLKKPQVVLGRIETRENSISTINPLSELTLESGDNDITFYFDANSFIDEDKNKLLYTLEGYMTKWEEISNLKSNTISFKNLPAGKYVLKMQIINAGGIASDVISSPVISINKPFYNQWWFYVSVIVAFFAVSFGVFYIYGQKKFEKDLILEVDKRSRELRSSEDRFRTLWESTSDALALYNLKGEIIIYNDTFLKFLGRTDNIAGRKIYELLELSGETMSKDSFRQNLELQQLKSQFELHTNRNGEDTILEFSNTYLLLPNEKSSVMLSLIRNITERKQTEENLIRAKNEAEQASRVKSAFLATMSHEIRTPLNAIIGMGSVISNTTLNDEQQSYISAIKTSSDSLLSLVNNILDFSKIEAGMMTLEKADVSPEEIIAETIEILGPLANEKGIYLYSRIHPDSPVKITTDKTRLRQVLINLVGNAIKFTEKGSIEITLRPDADNVLKIAVTDTGIGIPTDKINELFKVFTQVDDTTTRKYGGTGLGLAITDKLVSLLGGQIKVASQEGKGSQFTFTIKDFSGGKNKVTRSSTLQKYTGIKFGIVSPQPEVISIFRALNDERGIKTVTFSDLAGAAKNIGDIEVILVDAENITENTLPDELKNKELIIIKRNFKKLTAEVIAMLSVDKRNAVNLPISTGKYQKILDKLLKPKTGKPKATPTTPVAKAVTAPTSTLKILVVDDNKVNLMMMEVIMRNLGYAVDFANNGKEAVDKCLANKYNLVFMDVQMPEMDGIEATKHIKANMGNNFPAIVALTANAFPEDRQACLDAGMIDFLPKPVTMDTIKKLLENLFAEEKISAV
jgi:PAS domain S-box-containing protein